MRLLVLFAIALTACAQDKAKIELGRYLVEEAAACGFCHTPKTADGAFDKSKWLKGTTLDIQPIGTPPKDWHKASPDLTPSGKLWMKWGEASMLKYLQTGLTPSGKFAGPPMPVYKFKPEHAEAILAYLKTLK
jgi:mono/diheme cytochrome c family protein